MSYRRRARAAPSRQGQQQIDADGQIRRADDGGMARRLFDCALVGDSSPVVPMIWMHLPWAASAA